MNVCLLVRAFLYVHISGCRLSFEYKPFCFRYVCRCVWVQRLYPLYLSHAKLTAHFTLLSSGCVSLTPLIYYNMSTCVYAHAHFRTHRHTQARFHTQAQKRISRGSNDQKTMMTAQTNS